MKETQERGDTDGRAEVSDSPVLENLRGITDRTEMERLENRELLRVTAQFLQETGPAERFSTADICRMHRDWLKDVYPWAGEYRSRPMNRERVRFASPPQIPALMQEMEGTVLERYTPCIGSGDVVAEALAVVHTELILIHPFPDGNDRIARLLATLMAKQAGLRPPVFAAIDGEKADAYLDALWAGIGRDYAPMTELFREMIARRGETEGRGRK